MDKKIVKIYKALRLMEQAKHSEPKFSESIRDFAKFLSDLRSAGGDTMSRFSSVGETFKMGADNISNLTMGQAFGGIFGSSTAINVGDRNVGTTFSEHNNNKK